MEQESSTAPYPIIWRGTRVGTITDTVRDMWYLDGTWAPDDTETAVAFETLTRSFDVKKVFSDWTKGTRVIVEIPGPATTEVHSIVLGIQENVLMLRNVFDAEAVARVIKEVW